MLSRLATSCYRRRRWILLIWVAGLVGISMLSNAAGKAFSQEISLDGSDSQQAFDVLEERFPGRSGLTGDVVFKAEAGITDPAVRERLSALFERIRAVDGVTDVRTPYEGPMAAAQISPTGTIGYAIVQFGGKSSNDVARSTIAEIARAVDESRTTGLQVELGGFLFQEQEPPGTEAIGLLAAVVILLVAFGSVLAMGLPIATALFGIGVGFGVVNLLAHVTSVPSFATQLAAMIGIGVGIDYALFIVTRYRQALAEGSEPESAVVTAIDTAGRAVLFAGCTVVISLAGMLLIGIDFVQGLGLAAASVVAVTMVASVTLLPAILGFVGRNIDRLSIPGLGRRAHGSRQGFWFRWSRFLQRHPWPSAVLGLLLLVAMALPVFSMRLGSSDESNLPETMTVRRAYDLKAEGFGAGASGPLLLVAELPSPAQSPETMVRLVEAVRAVPGVAQVAPPMPNPSGDAAIIQVIPTTSSQDEATIELIERLRSEVLPAATAGTGVTVHVGGVTALFEDLAVQLQKRLPVFIAVVLALSFLLLLMVFRSVLVPVKAVLMNLLSIGAAYGVVVAVFQWGWGASALGVGKEGPIESFLPMMMFAILFGLSMDYEVFLLSRIKEEYDQTGDNSLAVADGLRATARVITAAALIMVTVFGSFMFGPQRVVKEFGLGLAIAVLIDATIVRMILVPATMELLGRTNWWFPRWLGWLPEVHIEGRETPVGSGAGDPDDGELALVAGDS